MSALPLLAWTACVPADAVETADPAPAVPGAYDPDLPAYSAPDVDLDALTESGDELFAWLLSFHADHVYAPYLEAMGWASADCPVFKTYSDSAIYWEDICETDAGASFNGDGFYAVHEGDDGGERYHRSELFTHSWLFGPAGEVFRGAGTAIFEERVFSGGHRTYRSELVGTFIATSAVADGAWLSKGVEDDLEMTLGQLASGSPQQVLVNGGVGGLEGAYNAAFFDGFKIGTAEGGWTCEGEPIGSVWFRSTDEAWVVVEFDHEETGRAIEPADPALCDGCGTASLNGEVLGSVCFDLSPLLTWEELP